MPERRLSEGDRREAYRRASAACEYCRTQAAYAPESLSLEHVVPRVAGGESALPNIALACQGCNNHKYTRTRGVDPATGETVRLFHPREQIWSEHFAWNEDCTVILGLTATGRTTVETLRLNRPGLVNLRRVLGPAGLHPPPGSK